MLSSCGGGGGHIKFKGAKTWLDDSEELNTLIELDVVKALKINNNYKSSTMDDSNLENELDHFNFEKTKIGADSKS